MTKSTVEKHFDKIAQDYDFYTRKRELHYSTLKKLLQSLIPKDKKVLEIGCGTGDILASLKPETGYGFDISPKMIDRAKFKYRSKANLTFSTIWPSGYFDYIFMSDVVEHLENSKETFLKISRLMGPKTIFINTMMNPVWIPVEAVYNFFGWKMPEGPHHRIKYPELKIKIERLGMKIIRHDYRLLMPIKIPFITNFLNKYLERYFKKLAFIEFLEAKVEKKTNE